MNGRFATIDELFALTFPVPEGFAFRSMIQLSEDGHTTPEVQFDPSWVFLEAYPWAQSYGQNPYAMAGYRVEASDGSTFWLRPIATPLTPTELLLSQMKPNPKSPPPLGNEATVLRQLLIQGKKLGLPTQGVLFQNRLDIRRGVQFAKAAERQGLISAQQSRLLQEWMASVTAAFQCNEVPWSGATKLCKDFSPSYDTDSAQEYQEKVQQCSDLLTALRAAGLDQEEVRAAFAASKCKRFAHLMLPGGRVAVRGKEVSWPAASFVRDETRQRLSTASAPFAARTQSPKSYALATARAAGIPYEKQLQAAIDKYRQSSTYGPYGLYVPSTIGPLVAAGFSARTAKVLVERAGGKLILPAATKPVSQVLQIAKKTAKEQVEHCVGGILTTTKSMQAGTAFAAALEGTQSQDVLLTGVRQNNRNRAIADLFDTVKELRRPTLVLTDVYQTFGEGEDASQRRLLTLKQIREGFLGPWASGVERFFEILLAQSLRNATGREFGWKLIFRGGTRSAEIEFPVRHLPKTGSRGVQHSQMWCDDEDESTRSMIETRSFRGMTLEELPKKLLALARRKKRTSSR